MLRILYVDDDVLAVRAVVRELRACVDVAIEGLTDPKEAIALLRRQPFDVVLSDFQMPVMDGVDLLAEAFKLRPDARRLILTGVPDEPKIHAACGEGLVECVLAKPVAAGRLREAVGALVRDRRVTPETSPS